MKIFTELQLNDLISNSKSLDDFKSKLESCDAACAVDGLDMQEGEVLVISFPAENAEAVQQLAPFIQQAYPNNPAIAVVNDIDMLIQYPEDAIKMLDGMKEKITAATGVSSIRDQILKR